MKTKNETPCPNWNPAMKYVWETKQVKAWLKECGANCFYNGILYKPIFKHIAAGMYDVSFKPLYTTP